MTETGQEILLPAFKGEEKSIEKEVIPRHIFSWLEQECEVLHINLGMTQENDTGTLGGGFLRGNKISWFELDIHEDVDRDITHEIEDRVIKLLSDRTTSIIELYHEPGAGGTTIAYRVAWNIHRKYPVLVLRSISNTTQERLIDVYTRTQQPLLLLIDNSSITTSQIDGLYEKILARQTPVLLLVVRREFELPQQTNFTYPISQALSNSEGDRFKKVLSKAVPAKRHALETASNKKMRTPFLFALTAFEKEFTGIKKFIKTRLKDISEQEQKIVVTISLIYYFAQDNVPAQLFAFLVSLPASRTVDLRKYLRMPRQGMLIAEEDGWRPLHFYVAEELLIQVLSGKKEREQWKELLPQYAVEIINFLGDAESHLGSKFNEPIAKILQNLFIERGGRNVRFGQTTFTEREKFSEYIEKIPTLEGKRLVFDTLVDIFDEVPHYWAHRSRFIWNYAKDVNDFKDAINSVDRALGLGNEGEDYVLHHIKGMGLAKWATNLMNDFKLKSATYTSDTINQTRQEIQEKFDNAKAEFILIIDRLNSNDERPYVSAIELLTRYIEFGKETSSIPYAKSFLN